MRRKYLGALEKWYTERDDRKPLILRGARQVGKSTLVHLFAEEFKLDLCLVNLEKSKFKAVEKEHFVVEDWVAEIEFQCGKKIAENSIIFIDEIQAQPQALAKLRYLYEERPLLAVIAAGSLLELALHEEEVSFPVGRVSFLWISPMTFTEFLEATNKLALKEAILCNTLSEMAHEVLRSEVKKYFFLGGMPKVIQTYIDTNSLLRAREIQNEILESFYNDFPKYERRAQIAKLNSIFQNLPFHLGKKVIYQQIDSSLRGADIKKCLTLFRRANLIFPCYHTSVSGVPLRATVDENVFKFYFLDIGLVNAAHQLSWSDLDEHFESSFVTKGFLAEQFVAQHLCYHTRALSGPECLFWLKDKSSSKAEIDFVVVSQGHIVPIEVKAGHGGRLKSFEVFAKEKQNIDPKIESGIKFSKDFFYDDKIKLQENVFFPVRNWPYYAVEGFISSASAGLNK